MVAETTPKQAVADPADAYPRVVRRSDWVGRVARRLPRRRVGAAIRAGFAAARAGEWVVAARHYQRGLARSPGLAPIWVQLGHLRKEQGDYHGAEIAYLRARALDASVADTHMQLGHLLKLQSRWAESAEAYARVLQLDPGQRPAEDELIALLPRLIADGCRAGEAGEWIRAAEVALRTALDRDAPGADIHLQLGRLMALQGRSAEAKEAYAAALRLDPSLVAARLALRALMGEATRMTATGPLVSVIVTCYNFEDYLREAVESVLAQTYSNLEIIIVDDSSTDDSDAIGRALAQEHPDVVHYYQQPHSGQPAGPRNFGIKIAKGEFIICLDGDDQLHHECVEKSLRALREHPTASIVHTDVLNFGEVDRVWVWPTQDYDFEALIYRANFICAGALYKKAVWRDVGGYKTNVRGVDDWNFWIEAGRMGHTGVAIRESLFLHRIRSDSLYNTEVVVNDFTPKMDQVTLYNAEIFRLEEVKVAAVHQLSAAAMGHVAFLSLMKRALCPRTYIGVGVGQGDTLLSDPVPGFVVGIDPEPLLTAERIAGCHNLLIMRSTSDAAFRELSATNLLSDRPADFAFVNGLRHCEVVLRDIANCARLSRPGALIFLHDLFPGNKHQASREPLPGGWMGDVYKVVPILWRFCDWLPSVLINDVAPSGMLVLRVTGDIYQAIFSQYDQMVAAMEACEFGPTLDEMNAGAVSCTSKAFIDFFEEALSSARAGDGSASRRVQR